jgi:hypothetical protein
VFRGPKHITEIEKGLKENKYPAPKVELIYLSVDFLSQFDKLIKNENFDFPA